MYIFLFFSVTSASYQARKLYGDVTPGDKTHENAKANFTMFFKRYARSLPNANKHIEKAKLQKSLSPLFQVK